jgi:hypothetical protein
MHVMDVNSLYAKAVANYPAGSRRHVLWQGFKDLYGRFIACGLAGLDIWVDGSFLTSKSEPNNINVVLWIPSDHIDACTQAQFDELRRLQDLTGILKKYGVHLFLTAAEDTEDAELFRDWFTGAYGPYETKGFAKITL